MIKNNKYLAMAIIFFFISIALNFPFPHEYPVGQEFSSAFNFPITTMDGVNYIGVTGLILFIISLFYLVKSLDQYHVRMVLIAIFLVVFLPMEMVKAYQNTFATGIYAIEYERGESNFTFEMKDETTLYAICVLPFENHSKETVQFNIKFYEKYLFEDDYPMLSLLNEGGPYKVTLHGKESKVITIETQIDLAKLGRGGLSGQGSGINLMIVDGKKVRKL
ncbi:hypothetical protein QNH36_11955 [Mesobacillus sp. AQ2]|jgi:hypothetical protein|uniref:hypothetical protein n=1 Tax=Bacillaceae TaxID=186817 RepID=UPI00119CF831|nr:MULTISPECIES: hypothetical protein [Bacillaceae]WHX42794.1 hypothetical protein QNH36_11955 [Mesobacillus sp. AQ2]